MTDLVSAVTVEQSGWLLSWMERKDHRCAGTGRTGGNHEAPPHSFSWVHGSHTCKLVLVWERESKEMGPTDHLAWKRKWERVWADGSIASCEREEEWRDTLKPPTDAVSGIGIDVEYKRWKPEDLWLGRISRNRRRWTSGDQKFFSKFIT